MKNVKKIFIVDDDRDCLMVVSTMLTSRGYDVEEFGSGKELLARLETCTPDLLFLDIMMPEMSGYDVAVRLKQQTNTQGIPIIMLTAKAEAEDLIVGYKDYGVDYYITKPFTSNQLFTGIELVLGEISEPSSEPTSP